jgi:hypothetical protein
MMKTQERARSTRSSAAGSRRPAAAVAYTGWPAGYAGGGRQLAGPECRAPNGASGSAQRAAAASWVLPGGGAAAMSTASWNPAPPPEISWVLGFGFAVCRCGGQFFNRFFGTGDQATNLTSHSKSTKQPLNCGSPPPPHHSLPTPHSPDH